MILEPRMVVHCPKEWEAREFIREAYEQGFEWGYGFNDETFYDKYKENTVYMLSDDNIIHYCNLEYLDVLHSVNNTYGECVKFVDLKEVD